MKPIKKVGVVGAGTMGSAIAQQTLESAICVNP
jgi:3-hydroxyacyl-CoA dehydrogenase